MNNPVVVATYEVPWAENLAERAHSIAIGMTIGSWNDINPARQKSLLEFRGEVGDISRESQDVGRFSIKYPVRNLKPSIASLLTVVFGKLSLDGQIRLVNLELPDEYARQFPGPSHGVPGLRAKFGVHHRPFVMSIFKRENGATLEEFHEAFQQQIDGGVDWVKDDEIYFNDEQAPLLERIRLTRQILADRAQRTGQLGLYALNLTGTPAQMRDNAKRALEAGADSFLIAPFVTGLDILVELRREKIDVPFIAHPAFSGGIIGPHAWGVSPDILLGLLPRLAGADIVLFPSPYGSVAIARPDALAIHRRLQEPGRFPEVISGPSAGIHAGLVSQLIEDFGYDIVINAGSAVHSHPNGTTAGARVLMDAVLEVCHGNA
ncbi:MAG: 2,3-diketo-5-methylthiopentyl-1-phosphate enolase [Sulfobacillus sp.]